MPPRPRARGRENWPEGLRCRNGYYSWVNPVNGKEYGIGRDKTKAITQAMEANLHATGLLDRERLVDRVRGTGRQTVSRWLDIYDARLKERHKRGNLAANTLRAYMVHSRRTRVELGANTLISTITPLIVSERLNAIAASGKEPAARQLRSFMKEAFREALVEGWLDANPVRETRLERLPVKRARLTLETFKELYELAEEPALRNAMALGIVSGQRRETVVGARFSEFREGAWWVVQGKTDAHVAIPLDLRLECVGLSLADVLRQCRSTGVLSPYLIHQTERRARRRVGAALGLDTLTAAFRRVVRASARDWSPNTPPTFHEIRSLSARLYASQGNVNVQELMGHRDPATTRLYQDSRGAEWVRVQVAAGAAQGGGADQ